MIPENHFWYQNSTHFLTKNDVLILENVKVTLTDLDRIDHTKTQQSADHIADVAYEK